jgi:hypothetical protein
MKFVIEVDNNGHSEGQTFDTVAAAIAHVAEVVREVLTTMENPEDFSIRFTVIPADSER